MFMKFVGFILDTVKILFRLLPDCEFTQKLVFKWFKYFMKFMAFVEKFWMKYYYKKYLQGDFCEQEILIKMKNNPLCPSNMHNAFREALEGTYFS